MFVLFLKSVIWICVLLLCVFLCLCDLNYVHGVMFILCFCVVLVCALNCYIMFYIFVYMYWYFNLFCCFLFVVMLCLYFVLSFYFCFCVVVLIVRFCCACFILCDCFLVWYFNSCSFWFDQSTTESNTAKCLCNRSARTERWQLESNHINVLVWHKCLTQALHSPDESHDIWETMIYTTTNSFLFRSVIPPKMATTSASLTTTKLRALMIATDDQWDHLWHVC